MVQIGDALAEDRTTRVNAEIGTGEAVLRPSAFMGALGGIGNLGTRRRKRGGKGQDERHVSALREP